MWALDQVTFRRLVWLYIASWACPIAFIGHEVLAPEWASFDGDFNRPFAIQAVVPNRHFDVCSGAAFATDCCIRVTAELFHTYW